MIEDKRILTLAADALTDQIAFIKGLFDDLDAEFTSEGARRCGQQKSYERCMNMMRARDEIEQRLYEAPKPWYKVGTDNFGSVYVCPYCNRKAPEKSNYCPHCGEKILV